MAVRPPATRRPPPPPARNPALIQHAQERAQSVENRVADRITAFAGSMNFVYLHIAWFGCWIAFRVENYPFGLLVSTFVRAPDVTAGVPTARRRDDGRRS